MQGQLGEAVHQNPALSKLGIQERLFSQLFEGLVYPQIWEDPLVDMLALDIQPQDNLVCIASGGCNMMSYLTRNPASVVAVDLSPAHVALNKLKLCAATHLADQRLFFQLFGQADTPENKALLEQQIFPHLDATTRNFWSANSGLRRQRSDMFCDGFYRYGVLGRFIGGAHILAKLTRVDFKPLLQCKTLIEQQAYFDSQINPLFEHRLFRFIARQPMALFGLGIPPAQFEKLAADGEGDILLVLKERLRKLICDFPIANNYFAWQAFSRAYQDAAEASLPPYLMPENFEAIQANASKARVVNQSLTELLSTQAPRSKHGYILLDAQDWMTDTQLNELWSEITRTAAPDARVIFRTGGAADILPGRVNEKLLSQWHYDAKASMSGFKNDRSAIYGGFHLYRRN